MRNRTTLVGTDHRARFAGMVLVNGTLAVCLTALYIGTASVLAWVLDERLAPIEHILATVAVAVSVVPLRARVLTLANRLLRRQWQASQELLRDVTDSLSHAIEPDALRSLLIADLPDRLRLETASLWMLEPPDDYAFVALGEPRDTAGASLLANGATAWHLAQLNPRGGYVSIPAVPDTEWLLPFSNRRLALVLPLRIGERLVGFYGCGQGANVRRVSRHVLEILVTLAPAIASAIENTRAYVTIAHLNEQLRTLDQLKGEFIESVGHELRTPLTTLHLSIELLHLHGEAPQVIAPIMRNSLGQLDTLVNQVLAFEAQNRRPGGRQAMANTLIAVEAFMGELTEQYLPVASAKGLRFVVEVEPGLAVWGVPARLQRGVREVLDNAVRYSDSGYVTLSAHFRDGVAVIRVTDQGPGIPTEERDMLFSAFYRGRSVRALAETPGAGLGLSIARHEIESLGGQIWLERTGPDGSVICASLPAILAHDEPEPYQRAVGA